MVRRKRKKKIGLAALPKKERVRIARMGGLARWGKLKKKKKRR